MYKIVRISDLNYSPTFGSSDKVIELNDECTKMTVGENDYAHKSKAYLSDCINTADKSLKSYRSTIDKIDTTYLTSSLNDVYLPEGSLITEETLDRIMSSNAFLTKDGCKEFETKCISYVNEMKNKAVSILMAQLNESFIYQNSAGKLTYGQVADTSQTSSDKNHFISWVRQIASSKSEISSSNYNFETGEFSFNQLLLDKMDFGGESASGWFKTVYIDPITSRTYNSLNEITDQTIKDRVVPTIVPASSSDAGAFYQSSNTKMIDFWKDHYSDAISSYFQTEEFEDFDEIQEQVGNILVFNADTDISSSPDYKVHVPKASYDFKKNETIPIVQLVELFLKAQIRTVIKRVCDKYISKMVSVPKFTSTSNS